MQIELTYTANQQGWSNATIIEKNTIYFKVKGIVEFKVPFIILQFALLQEEESMCYLAHKCL
jgi:hypothetical protein